MKKILFAGTFDPFTVGHQAIVKRALPFFDEVIIGIGQNMQKKTFFSLEKRLSDIQNAFENEPRVRVLVYESLTADFAKEIGAEALLRSVRNIADFEYERSVADANRRLFGLETLLLIAEPEYAHVSSSLVRELLAYGKDASKLLPEK
ncbi:MAG: pantetheine-phosphate adenylyltransferase [Prevotellaceae bacterium]|jgi:pantetheine-phosphate adenylyltransferase|nr:pantetheine-phosphate adenylyltransferase [Prevotellaceae bacterium]